VGWVLYFAPPGVNKAQRSEGEGEFRVDGWFKFERFYDGRSLMFVAAVGAG